MSVDTAIGADLSQGVVVIFASTWWDGIWMSEKHVALHLAATTNVLWVDPPISVLTPFRNAGARTALRGPALRPISRNLWRLTPRTTPGVSRRYFQTAAEAQVRLLARRAARRLNARVDGVIVAGSGDYLGTFPAARTMFYGTDDFVAGADLMGVDRAALVRATERQLRLADEVVAISPALAGAWSAMRPAVTVIPNGCETGHFAGTETAALPADVRLPSPIAGFVGHLSDRIDLGYLEALADTGMSLLLVGPRQPTFAIARVAALLARPNVQWVGEKYFEELPSYLRVIDVGLTPYADSSFNRASFPLKTLEYLAAGRPAVVSDIPASRMLATECVRIARSPAEFAALTQAALAGARDGRVAAACRRFAEQHDWSRRAAEIADVLRLPASGDRRTRPEDASGVHIRE